MVEHECWDGKKKILMLETRMILLR